MFSSVVLSILLENTNVMSKVGFATYINPLWKSLKGLRSISQTAKLLGE